MCNFTRKITASAQKTHGELFLHLSVTERKQRGSSKGSKNHGISWVGRNPWGSLRCSQRVTSLQVSLFQSGHSEELWGITKMTALLSYTSLWKQIKNKEARLVMKECMLWSALSPTVPNKQRITVADYWVTTRCTVPPFWRRNGTVECETPKLQRCSRLFHRQKTDDKTTQQYFFLPYQSF